MIKRYNQFVKGINEEFEMGEGQPSPITRPAGPITTPDTPTRPRPTRPGITPTEVPSEEDAPLAYGYGDELPEEEGGEYQGQILLHQLADELGTEVNADGSINYEGKKINFYSETEKFHVDNKKFSTVEEVVNYLGSTSMTTGDSNMEMGMVVDEAFLGISLQDWWNILHPAAIIATVTAGSFLGMRSNAKKAIIKDLKDNGEKIPDEKVLNALATKAIGQAMDQTTGAGKGSESGKESNEAFLGVSLQDWWNMLHPAAIIATVAGGTFMAMRSNAKKAIVKDLKDNGEKIPDEKTLNALATKAIGQAMDQTTGAGKGSESGKESNEAFLGISLQDWWNILHPAAIIATVTAGSFLGMRSNAKKAIVKDLEASGEKIPDEKTLNALATKAIGQAMDQTTGAGKGSESGKESNEAFLGISLQDWWNMLHPAAIIATVAGGTFMAMRSNAKKAIVKDLKDNGEKIPDEKTLNALATKAIGQAMDQTTGAGKGSETNESKSYRHTRLKKFGQK